MSLLAIDKVKREVALMRGIGVSAGIVIGKVYLLDSRKYHVEAAPYCHLDESLVEGELKRFKDALDLSKEQLSKIRDQLTGDGRGKEHAGIIDAHLMILNDQLLIDDTIKLIKAERVSAEWALKSVLKDLVALFDKIDDPYFKERSSDIEHIVDRIMMNLSGKEHESLGDIKEPSVVVAHDLSPADTAQMIQGNVLAFLTDIGAKTSHTAILARSLEIPAVVGLEDVTNRVESGDTIIVDGMTGAVIINPSTSVIKVYEKRRKRYEDYEKTLLHYKDLPAETIDGHTVSLLGNMEIVEEIPSLMDHGADGIGLYRSEFLYVNRDTLPSEEEHLAAYKHVAKKMGSRSAVIRTFDVGGDKLLSSVDGIEEGNPALGLRAIRFCLKYPDIFKTQLRAILRASAYGKLKILFPMISGVEELRRAKALLYEARCELEDEGEQFDHDIEVGIMIEVPSAALIADILAEEVDFFSIGTNDLLQYSLAIDRVNEHVAYLYEPFHPAVLRIIKTVVDAGKRHGIGVSVCGEMAGEPEHALIFLGLGIDSLSMSARSLLKVKKLIRSVKYHDAVNISKAVLGFSTAREVEGYIETKLVDLYKEEPWS
ncbi:MAG: phosphoenolpyruvate--protein phosphotransferase [Deltaproteobacteria bacterium]|nr:phosphoenolpyruvate--protein phosphotransferase [Deltaproteobacteria bacterium]